MWMCASIRTRVTRVKLSHPRRILPVACAGRARRRRSGACKVLDRLTVGEVFAGIGGIGRGLEATGGFRTKWQVEIDPYAVGVLEREWPTAERRRDIRRTDFRKLPSVDVIAGGFPCVDISTAGKRAGISAPRSGLWAHYARAIREARPSLVIVENVAALRVRGLDRVLADLASVGYDAEWDCVPASSIGAPHIRDRIFVLAYPRRQQSGEQDGFSWSEGRSFAPGDGAHGQVPQPDVSHGDGSRRAGPQVLDEDHEEGPHAARSTLRRRRRRVERVDADSDGDEHQSRPPEGRRTLRGSAEQDVSAHAQRGGRQARVELSAGEPESPRGGPSRAHAVADGVCSGCEGPRFWGPTPQRSQWWEPEPGLGRTPDGVSSGLYPVAAWERGVPRTTPPRTTPKRADRLRCLGNSVVPQVAEHVGRLILAGLARETGRSVA